MAAAKTRKTPAQPAPARAAKSAAAAGGEVERRWKEYWARRKQLEDAVEKVRAATEALRGAQADEKTRRAEFDEVKRSLTTLLDVDPVGQPAREPIQLPRSLPEVTPKQAG
jgi:hypothetical protein